MVLLDRAKVAAFLRSVAYVQATAEMAHIQKHSIGLLFSTAEVDTGNEKTKEDLVATKLSVLMHQFAESASKGSRSATEFLRTQQKARDQANDSLQHAFAEVQRSNSSTQTQLNRWIAGLKTTEYGAGMVITVAGLFVSASAALAAGIIAFAYDTVTNIIDDHHQAGSVNADFLALAGRNLGERSLAAAAKEKAKDVLAGKELEAIEKLEEKVTHLHEKIAIKREMIQNTSSQRYAHRLARSIGKNEAQISTNMKSVVRYRSVTWLFAVWDLYEKGEKIYEAWHPESQNHQSEAPTQSH